MPLLESNGVLNAVTLLEELQRRYPGSYDTTVLRTLQRRVRQSRAVFGPEREVYFAQVRPPSRLAVLIPNSRQIYGTGRPASTRFKAAMIWLSVNLDFFT